MLTDGTFEWTGDDITGNAAPALGFLSAPLLPVESLRWSTGGRAWSTRRSVDFWLFQTQAGGGDVALRFQFAGASKEKFLQPPSTRDPNRG